MKFEIVCEVMFLNWMQMTNVPQDYAHVLRIDPIPKLFPFGVT